MACDHETYKTPAIDGNQTDLEITGMSCGNCARRVNDILRAVPGVRSAAVNLDTETASVRWESAGLDQVPELIKAVQAAGYEARVIEKHAHDHGEHKLAAWRLNLIIGVVGTLPLMLGEWFLGLGGARWFQWFSFVAATVVQVFAGGQFYRGAWIQLRAGQSNMDTLVALGSTTAYAYSLWALLTGQPGHVYFMEAAAIITLVSIGHWMESRVSVRASSTLRKLLSLAPDMALRRDSSGRETQVRAAELLPGDLVVLRPGEKVPADGEVVEGDSTVEESMLTGESAPVAKSTKSPLYAGTLNLNSRLLMLVTATGEATALAQIVAAVQRAQSSRANIQRLGDAVSNVFVPIVVAIAAVAGLWWGFAPDSAHQVHSALGRFLWPAHVADGRLAAAFIIAAAVLIIACPCAMGLATPTAIMAGANVAASRGILIRDGVALEKAGEITVVLFDKTGTLTIGKPAVVKSWESPQPAGGFPAITAVAAALARHSTHPMSRAIAQLGPDGPALVEWNEVRGAGIEAKVATQQTTNGSDRASLGALSWLSDEGVDLSAGQNFIDEWSSQGATLVGLAQGKRLTGLFAIKDAIKPGAREVLARLNRQGLKTFLVTGDNPVAARSIAREAGFNPERVFAQVRPEEKAQLVKRLQQQNERVAFAGDGINDAPALEQADLGIAVARASDIAREAADIVLINSDLEAIPASVGLARATLRTIKQNLFWAFFYNAVGVPLAALGFMSPVLCAAAMGLSDVVVIGNALRLRRWRPKTNAWGK